MPTFLPGQAARLDVTGAAETLGSSVDWRIYPPSGAPNFSRAAPGAWNVSSTITSVSYNDGPRGFPVVVSIPSNAAPGSYAVEYIVPFSDKPGSELGLRGSFDLPSSVPTDPPPGPGTDCGS